jgi:glucokinase
MILVGDIGGTKTRLALLRPLEDRFAWVFEQTYPSREHAGLAEIVDRFLRSRGEMVGRACFGIAGPVRDGRSETTNLPWVVDRRVLARDAGIVAVDLINDLEAAAHGLAVLPPESLAVLQPGAPRAAGNAAVVAAGTGLGEAGLYWDGARHRPFATEGGHAGFSPSGDLQIELLRYLEREHRPVSWERILSGPGLVNLYRFLRDTGRGEEPVWLAEQLRGEDPAPPITRAALEGRSDLASLAVDLFVTLYGVEAGNVALKFLATGGVYLAGGIAPRLVERLKGPLFLEAFNAKGRMSPLLRSMPVRVVLDDRLGLLGAGHYASLRAAGRE